MTPKLTNSPIAVWARTLFPKATTGNPHIVDYHHNSFLAQSSQQQRLASTVSEYQKDYHGFYQKNTQAPDDHQNSNEAWYQNFSPNPTAKLAIAAAGTSAAFWFNHNRNNEQAKWKQQLPKELAEVAHEVLQTNNGWLEKGQILGDYVSRLSVLLDGTCPTKHVYMMGIKPEKRIPPGHEPLTPPLTPESSPPENTTFDAGQGEGKQSQTPNLESAIFDFESFINRNLARAENITGLYYARHAEGLRKKHSPRPNYTPAHFFHLASQKFHPSAQFNLALCYHYGKGGVSYVDLPKAIEYYTLAAADGHKMAQYNLGVLYQKGGEGIHKDVALGLSWLQKAAEGENGYLPAKLAIALARKNGVEGILPKDGERAKEILRRVLEDSNQKIANMNASVDSDGAIANPILELTSISSAALANFYLESWSNNGLANLQDPLSISARYHLNYLSHPHSPSAAYNLGVLYDRHLNNLPLAVKCYKLSVHLGAMSNVAGSDGSSRTSSLASQEDIQCVQNAMWNLGVIYAKGKGGMQKDLKAAKKWFDAVHVKDPEMRKVVKWLERKMSKEQITLPE